MEPLGKRVFARAALGECAQLLGAGFAVRHCEGMPVCLDKGDGAKERSSLVAVRKCIDARQICEERRREHRWIVHL